MVYTAAKFSSFQQAFPTSDTDKEIKSSMLVLDLREEKRESGMTEEIRHFVNSFCKLKFFECMMTCEINTHTCAAVALCFFEMLVTTSFSRRTGCDASLKTSGLLGAPSGE